MAHLLADENFPFPAVEALRQLEHDVVTLADLGQAQKAVPDTDVLEIAIAASRAVVTLNRRHFVRLHAGNRAHAGIIVCSFDPNFLALAQRIDEALRGLADLNGVLVRIARSPTV